MADDEITSIPEQSHMRGLAATVTLIFDLAETAGLPDPCSMTVYGIIEGRVHDYVTLQFPAVDASRTALVEWVLCFGGVLSSEIKQRETGPQLWVSAEFTFEDLVTVHAF